MTETHWELAVLLSKLVAYISFVSLTGGLFILILGALRRAAEPSGTSYLVLWSAPARRRLVHLLILYAGVGKLAMVFYFVFQVGQINQNGLAGMFDWFMIKLLAQTTIGAGVGFRLAGFIVLGAVLLVYRGKLTGDAPPSLSLSLVLLAMLGVLLCCAGFGALGHVANLSLVDQAVLSLHVLCVGLWIGALYPLFLLCRTEQATAIAPLMKRFGDLAWFITVGLTVAGVYLLTQLLTAPGELFTSAYGRLLLLKLVLVLCLLSLGALNKFRLVPALMSAGTAPLQRSIKGEMALGIIILIVTAVLSTVTGPAGHMG